MNKVELRLIHQSPDQVSGQVPAARTGSLKVFSGHEPLILGWKAGEQVKVDFFDHLGLFLQTDPGSPGHEGTDFDLLPDMARIEEVKPLRCRYISGAL
jgi:hypothetical protein